MQWICLKKGQLCEEILGGGVTKYRPAVQRGIIWRC